MTAADGNFYIAMAFDHQDHPVARVGQGHGIRIHETFGKAQGQVRRWRNGEQWSGGRLHNHFPRSKVFRVVYALGQLVAEEVEVEDKAPKRKRGRR